MEELDKKEINCLAIGLIRYFLEANNIKFNEVYTEAPILEELILNQSFLSHTHFLRLVDKLEKKFNDPDIIEKTGQTASCLRPNGLVNVLVFHLLNVKKIMSFYPKYFKYFYTDGNLSIIQNDTNKTIIEINFPIDFKMSLTDKKFIRGLLCSIPIKRKAEYIIEEMDEANNIYVVIFNWQMKKSKFAEKISVYEMKINSFLRRLRKKIKNFKKVDVADIKERKTKPKLNLKPKINIKINFNKLKFKNAAVIVKDKIIKLLPKLKRKKPEVIDLRKTIHEEMLEYESRFKEKEEEKKEILDEPVKVIEEVEMNIQTEEDPNSINAKFERVKQKLKEEIEFSQKMRNINNKLMNKIEYLEKVNSDAANELKSEKIVLERMKEDFKNLKENIEALKIKKNTFVYDIVQNLKGPILRIVTSLEIVSNGFSSEDEDKHEFLKEALNASHEILSLVGYSIEFNKDVEQQQVFYSEAATKDIS